MQDRIRTEKPAGMGSVQHREGSGLLPQLRGQEKQCHNGGDPYIVIGKIIQTKKFMFLSLMISCINNEIVELN